MRLSEVARRLGGKVIGSDVEVADLCSARHPKPGCLAYAESRGAAEALQKTDVAAILGPPTDSPLSKPLLAVAFPKEAMARALALFRPASSPPPTIHAQACVSSKAHIAEGVSIGPFAVVEENARIGAASVIYPLAFVGRGVVIGERCTLYPGSVVMENCILGDEVTLLPGAIVGGEGFGFYADEKGVPQKIPQRGGVQIGHRVEVGANSNIDSGAIDPTRLGNDTKLDNLIQIGHNVEIGESVRIAAQAGIAGSTEVGAHATIGPQAGLRDHIKVGDHTTVVGQSGVFGDLPPNTVVSGYPATPHQRALRILAITQQLPEILERLKQIEKKCGASERPSEVKKEEA